eukprot:scaffold47095_cov49-Attheya_sp.AAC.5
MWCSVSNFLHGQANAFKLIIGMTMCAVSVCVRYLIPAHNADKVIASIIGVYECCITTYYDVESEFTRNAKIGSGKFRYTTELSDDSQSLATDSTILTKRTSIFS